VKSLVNGLATIVRRAPWAIIAGVVVVSVVLAGLSGRFTPEEDSNASFAPDAPELTAADDISDIFGAESTTAVMQVIVTADNGDLFSLTGLQVVSAIEDAVRSGSLGGLIVESDQQPGVLSWLTPLQQAVFEGAAEPSSDAEVRQLYLNALSQMPEETAGFARQLLPATADLSVPTADKGLMIVLTSGAATTEEFDAFVDISALAAEEIRQIQLPAGLKAEPFSFELLFADQDEFQAEIGRLFGTAALIIVLVLALVFMIVPGRRGPRAIMIGGVAAVSVGILIVVLPTLATVLDSVFPDGIKDWNSNALFGIVALSLLALLLLWTFVSRSLRRTAADTILTIITIFMAISWMNGIGFLLYEDANPMVTILPILLIGLGVDYSIHLTGRYRDEMADGEEVDEAIAKAIKTVGVALVLATATTAVGFLTNITNDIPALREFGLLAAVGIFASFLLMLTFVPAVRELLDRRGVTRGTVARDRLRGGDSRALGRLIGKTSWIAHRAAAVAVTASLILGVFGFIGFTNLNPQFSFLDFIPTTSPLRGTFATLLEDFGGGFGENTQILVQGDVATAEAWNAMVVANQSLADTPNVVTFAGSPAGTSPVAAIAQLAQQDSATFVPAVGLALESAGVDPATFQFPDGGDVASVFDSAFAAAPDLMASVLRQTGNGGYDAALYDITTQAGEGGAGRLRLDVLDDFAGVRESGLKAVATSDEIINDVIVTTLRDSQTASLWLTLVAALILLVIAFWVEGRRPMLGVITTIPVFLVVMWSFGLMVVFGIPFGPVTATISALAIGIGIPYMIHITHRYLEDRERAETIEEAITQTLRHTGGALAGSAITTVAGFGILVTSTTIPFRQFGFVTAYTILLAMLAAVLVLPSMLVLWDRFNRRGES